MLLKMTTNHDKIQTEILGLLDNHFKNDPNRLYSPLTTEGKLRLVFKNYRCMHGKNTGIRLSHFGQSLLCPVLDNYNYDHKFGLSLGILVALDKYMLHPYHIDDRDITFYSKEDAAWFKMGGYDLKGFTDMI